MKSLYYAQRELVIDNKEIKAGDLVATVEPAAGIPLERAVAAIVNGHATTTEPEKAAAKKPAPPAAPPGVPLDSTK